MKDVRVLLALEFVLFLLSGQMKADDVRGFECASSYARVHGRWLETASKAENFEQTEIFNNTFKSVGDNEAICSNGFEFKEYFGGKAADMKICRTTFADWQGLLNCACEPLMENGCPELFDKEKCVVSDHFSEVDKVPVGVPLFLQC